MSPLAAYRRWHAGWREGWRHDLSRPRARLYAHIDAEVMDHGFLRAAFPNRHTVVPGIWRSNQPSPRQLARWARRGLRTVLNVRGANTFGSYALEAEACRRLGIDLIDLRLRSRALPDPADIHALKRVFDTAERPLLIHCKSGADRAGLAAACFVLFAGGTPAEAQAQLSLRYLHLRHAKTGILDQFVAAYAAHNAATPTPFLDWVDSHYDPAALRAGFTPGGLSAFFADTVLGRE